MTGQKISIAQLRPTQMTLGLDEVASRAAKIAAMGPADLEALLKKKPIPYVLGPGKQIYIVDHHHLARALWSLKIPEAQFLAINSRTGQTRRPRNSGA